MTLPPNPPTLSTALGGSGIFVRNGQTLPEFARPALAAQKWDWVLVMAGINGAPWLLAHSRRPSPALALALAFACGRAPRCCLLYRTQTATTHNNTALTHTHTPQCTTNTHTYTHNHKQTRRPAARRQVRQRDLGRRPQGPL